MRQVSIIIPVYYNEASLPVLIDKIFQTISPLKKFKFELIFVEDGSGDNSFKILEDWARKDKRVKILKLSRNFGSQHAVMAGLGYASGDCQIVMGADLQAPPDIIPRFLEQWEKGHKIVVGSRQERHDPWLTIFLANIYYFLIKFSTPNLPKGGFDVLLMDNKVRKYLLSIGSRNTLLEISIIWSGFPLKEVPYIRSERPFGKSRWTLFRKVKLAIDSLTAYSYLPVLFLLLSGSLFLALGAVGLMFFGLGNTFASPPTGAALCLCLLGIGLNGLGLGILGEYLWRNLQETRRFPGFVVEKEIGFSKRG